MNEVPEDPPETRDRWSLIRDIAVLQAKLVVDGFRDLLLVPASLIADMDEIVGRIEAFVVDEEKRGGITTQAKKRFDQALDALHRRGKAGP